MTTLSKFARTTLISSVMTIAMTGPAFASADISTTGPDSVNKIEIENSTRVEISNYNNVTVKNDNNQTASTGDASVKGNTTGGSAISGNASNSNSVSTLISIDNPTSSLCDCLGGNGGDGGSIGGSNGGTSNLGGSGGSTAKGGGSGSVGMLPETGASSPIDVSALRNLFNPASQTTPLSEAVKANKSISVAVLGLAAVLSLIGAISTAVYSTKRTLKV